MFFDSATNVEMETDEFIAKNYTKRHPHADLIIAWANGAKIEVLCEGEWDYIEDPSWYRDSQYRIACPAVFPKTTLSENAELINDALRVFVESGELAKYVAKHGTDGKGGVA